MITQGGMESAMCLRCSVLLPLMFSASLSQFLRSLSQYLCFNSSVSLSQYIC